MVARKQGFPEGRLLLEEKLSAQLTDEVFFIRILPHFFCNQKKPSKACEVRPVDDEASRVWRRGQNIQGDMPKNILGTARECA